LFRDVRNPVLSNCYSRPKPRKAKDLRNDRNLCDQLLDGEVKDPGSVTVAASASRDSAPRLAGEELRSNRRDQDRHYLFAFQFQMMGMEKDQFPKIADLESKPRNISAQALEKMIRRSAFSGRRDGHLTGL